MSLNAVSDETLLILAHFELCNLPSKLSNSIFNTFLCLSFIEVLNAVIMRRINWVFVA